jgi:hypothetical protein
MKKPFGVSSSMINRLFFRRRLQAANRYAAAKQKQLSEIDLTLPERAFRRVNYAQR